MPAPTAFSPAPSYTEDRTNFEVFEDESESIFRGESPSSEEWETLDAHEDDGVSS